MQPVTIGTIEVRRVEEMIWTISPRYLFAGITYEELPQRELGWHGDTSFQVHCSAMRCKGIAGPPAVRFDFSTP